MALPCVLGRRHLPHCRARYLPTHAFPYRACQLFNRCSSTTPFSASRMAPPFTMRLSVTEPAGALRVPTTTHLPYTILSTLACSMPWLSRLPPPRNTATRRRATRLMVGGRKAKARNVRADEPRHSVAIRIRVTCCYTSSHTYLPAP